MINLATVELYRSLMGDAKPNVAPEYVASIEARILSVSAKVEKYLGRAIESKERTEYFTAKSGAGTKSVALLAYPVSELASVSVWGSTLSQDSSFEIDTEEGIVSFLVPVYRARDLYQRAICVTYTGGMAEDTADFISKYPDIATEVCMQVYFEISRQKNIADKTTATGAGIVTTHLEYKLQPNLIEVLEQHIRPKGIV